MRACCCWKGGEGKEKGKGKACIDPDLPHACLAALATPRRTTSHCSLIRPESTLSLASLTASQAPQPGQQQAIRALQQHIDDLTQQKLELERMLQAQAKVGCGLGLLPAMCDGGRRGVRLLERMLQAQARGLGPDRPCPSTISWHANLCYMD